MSQIELAPQTTIEAQNPLAAAGVAMQQFAGRIGSSLRSGIEAVREIPRSITTLRTVGVTAVALFAASHAETANAADSESLALGGNVPTLVGAEALPGAPTVSRPNINSYKMGVGKAVEVSNGIHYLDSATFTGTPEIAETSSSSNLRQTCKSAILTPPEISQGITYNPGQYIRQTTGTSVNLIPVPGQCINWTRIVQGKFQQKLEGQWTNESDYWQPIFSTDEGGQTGLHELPSSHSPRDDNFYLRCVNGASAKQRAIVRVKAKDPSGHVVGQKITTGSMQVVGNPCEYQH